MATTQQMPARPWDIPAGPILLVGQPPRLTGMLKLINRGDDKIKIKSLPIRVKLSDKDDAYLDLELELSARLPARGSSHVIAGVPVGEDIAPGNYAAEVDLGGERRAAVLHVLERRDLMVLPESFELFVTPGASLVRPVVITNLGNVAFVVPKVALVPLGQRGALFSNFHIAIAQKGQESHQAALNRYASLLSQAEPEPMKAVFRGIGGETIAAGETRAGEIEFEPPAKLARHGQYLGQFNVGSFICGVELSVDNGTPTTDHRPRGKR